MQAERQSSLPGFEGFVPGEKRDRVQKNLGLTSEGVMSKMTFLSRNRGRVIACITWFVAGLVGTSPTTGRADEIGPADPVLPLPLYHNKPDNFGLFDGGLFFATSFAAYKQTNPISHQGVALSGLHRCDWNGEGSLCLQPGHERDRECPCGTLCREVLRLGGRGTQHRSGLRAWNDESGHQDLRWVEVR